jgi:hypothetical protein
MSLISDPSWVIEHAVKAQLADLRAASEARTARLESARAKERKSRMAGTGSAFRLNGKRAKVVKDTEGLKSGSERNDDQFLPEDKADTGQGDDGVYLSKEVRDLMAK